MARQLHLNLFFHSRGHHEASWRHPNSSPLPLTDIRYYQDLARKAEAAKFDSIFLADQLALGEDAAQAARTWLEPITVLAALAVSTSRIGLIATCSTTYTEPFNLARQFASIDHISNGRAGWNIVTSWLATAARNFGDTGQVSHEDRYARAEEFMTVVNGLWDSWGEDAVLDDRAAGRYARPDRIRPINHRGQFYRVAGPLNMPRCPQGRPVLVQAGSSDTGRRFAARHAEAVFTAHMEKRTAQAFYADLKAAGARRGQAPGSGADPAGPVADDRLDRGRGEADGRANSTSSPIPRSGASGCRAALAATISRICRSTGRWLPEDFPDPASVQAARSRTEVIINIVRRDKPDPAAATGLHGRRARPFHDGGDAGTGRRSDRGLVHRRRRGRVQRDAAAIAEHAGGVQRRGDPAVAAARPVPHRVFGNHAARALRSRLAENRVRAGRGGGMTTQTPSH